MIEISIFQKDDKTIRVRSKGHAGYADKGQDIVCAAVSVLLINTVNSLDRFTEDEILLSDVKSGDLEFSFPKGSSHDGDLLMKSLILGLKEIAKEYGEEYISLKFQEV